MKKEFKFSFLCDENFTKMNEGPSNTRHCTKCERNIVDFTKYTPKQIIDLIKGHDKACGFMRPWQVDEINKFLVDAEKRSSPLFKLVKVAAVAGSPLFFNAAVAQKPNTPVEMNGQARLGGKLITIIVLRDKDDVPMDSVNIDVYADAERLGSLKTDSTGKITLDHADYAGKSEIVLKNTILGIEKKILLKEESVCMIWKTSLKKDETPETEEWSKFDLKFVYRDENDKPIRFTKAEIQVYDTANVLLETLNIKTNIDGYSGYSTNNLRASRYILFTLYTKEGRRTAYLDIDNLKKSEVNFVRVDKKFRQHFGGVVSF